MIGFLKLVVVVAIILVTALSTFKVTKNQRGDTDVALRKGPLFSGLFALVVSFVLLSGVGSVPAGSVGVVLRFGATTGRTLAPGIYLVNPIAESVHEMDVQVHAEAGNANASSKDLQVVQTQVTLNYAVSSDAAGKLYQDVGEDYVARIILPAIQEAVKSTTAQYNAENLIVERPTVRAGIESYLQNRLIVHGIRVDAVSITDFQFSKDFNEAIEAKVTATQRALKAENDLTRIKTEAAQRVAQAEAEAKAIQIQAESISKQGGPEYVELKRIEKWDGKLPTMIVGGNSNMLFGMKLPNEK